MFLAAYAWPILEPDLPVAGRRACALLVAATWLAFGIDYMARLALSNARTRFVLRHPFDLLVLVLPLLRPLRLLRLVKLLSVLNRRAGGSLRGRVAVYAAGSTALVLVVGALAALDAEREAKGANITSFGDAAWWAATTVSTVGYGDRFPVTAAGRAVGATLMLTGIALLGVVTATFASWLLSRVAVEEENAPAATQDDLRALRDEVAALRKLLEADRGR